jgi:hypothetical protein
MARGLIKALGVAGAALTAWYFLDPKKGAERRGNFAKSTKDLYDSAADEIGRLGKDLAGGVSDVVSKVSEMTGLGSGSESGSDKTSAQSAATSRSENYSAPISA